MNDAVRIMPVRAVVFDFDGVLVDSEPYWDRADARLLQLEGRALLPEAKKAVIGLSQEVSIRKLLAMHGIDGDPEVFMRRREKMMEEYYGAEIPLMPGAAAALAALHGRGMMLAVASSTPRRLVELSLARHGVRALFAHVVTAEEVTHGKPAPDVFLRAFRLLDVSPGEAIVVEDSLPGIIGAVASGALAVWMINQHQPEARGKAARTVASLADLVALVVPAH